MSDAAEQDVVGDRRHWRTLAAREAEQFWPWTERAIRALDKLEARESELAQARELLRELFSWVSVPRDKEHPLRQILSRTRAFLEATDG